MNRMEIFDKCCSLPLEDKLTLRDDLNNLLTIDIDRMRREIKVLDTDYWGEVNRYKRLEDTLADRLEEIKELKKNG